MLKNLGLNLPDSCSSFMRQLIDSVLIGDTLRKRRDIFC